MSLEHQSDLMEILKDRFEQSGRSMRDVAIKAGITPGAISHAFKHGTGMNIRNYQRVAEELGLTVQVIRATTSENGMESPVDDHSLMFTD